jgi:hypothetical protein
MGELAKVAKNDLGLSLRISANRLYFSFEKDIEKLNSNLLNNVVNGIKLSGGFKI